MPIDPPGCSNSQQTAPPASSSTTNTGGAQTATEVRVGASAQSYTVATGSGAPSVTGDNLRSVLASTQPAVDEDGLRSAATGRFQAEDFEKELSQDAQRLCHRTIAINASGQQSAIHSVANTETPTTSTNTNTPIRQTHLAITTEDICTAVYQARRAGVSIKKIQSCLVIAQSTAYQWVGEGQSKRELSQNALRLYRSIVAINASGQQPAQRLTATLSSFEIRKAVVMAKEAGIPVSKIAKYLGIVEDMISTWPTNYQPASLASKKLLQRIMTNCGAESEQANTDTPVHQTHSQTNIQDICAATHKAIKNGVPLEKIQGRWEISHSAAPEGGPEGELSQNAQRLYSSIMAANTSGRQPTPISGESSAPAPTNDSKFGTLMECVAESESIPVPINLSPTVPSTAAPAETAAANDMILVGESQLISIPVPINPSPTAPPAETETAAANDMMLDMIMECIGEPQSIPVPIPVPINPSPTAPSAETETAAANDMMLDMIMECIGEPQSIPVPIPVPISPSPPAETETTATATSSFSAFGMNMSMDWDWDSDWDWTEES